MNNKLMMISNIFLILPVFFSFIYNEWLYFFFALGLFIFSPLYHYLKIKKINGSIFYFFKNGDWVFAISAFIYMYYFVYRNLYLYEQIIFYILLTLVLLFFWYGYKKADYKKWHPYFHIIAPIISSFILIFAN